MEKNRGVVSCTLVKELFIKSVEIGEIMRLSKPFSTNYIRLVGIDTTTKAGQGFHMAMRLSKTESK